MAHLMLVEKYQDCIVIIAQTSLQFMLNDLRIIVFIIQTIYKFPSYFLCTYYHSNLNSGLYMT